MKVTLKHARKVAAILEDEYGYSCPGHGCKRGPYCNECGKKCDVDATRGGVYQLRDAMKQVLG